MPVCSTLILAQRDIVHYEWRDIAHLFKLSNVTGKTACMAQYTKLTELFSTRVHNVWCHTSHGVGRSAPRSPDAEEINELILPDSQVRSDFFRCYFLRLCITQSTPLACYGKVRKKYEWAVRCDTIVSARASQSKYRVTLSIAC